MISSKKLPFFLKVVKKKSSLLILMKKPSNFIEIEKKNLLF